MTIRWRGPHGVVHVVGLHTNTSIRTECGVFIVRDRDIWVQVNLFEPSHEAPNCLECLYEEQENA